MVERYIFEEDIHDNPDEADVSLLCQELIKYISNILQVI